MKRRGLSVCALLFSVGLGVMTERSMAQQNPRDLAIPSSARIHDVFSPLLPEEVSIQGGFLGPRIDANETNRMLKVDEDDLLDAFERREAPHQDWQGEHVGKFLHAAMLTWNYRKLPELKTKVDRVVTRLLKTQESDGYLGTYSKSHRWTSWDVWIHKYDLLGLLTYYQFTRLANHDRPTPLGLEALNACRRIGDLLIATFGDEPGKRDINKSGEHVGMAPDSVLEPIVLLYRATGDHRYLDFAHYIVRNYDAPGGPAILASLAHKGTVRSVANAKAYEMTSNFNGLLELYRVTGEARLLHLMQVAWSDIAKNRLYITGSASAWELFQDDHHFPNQSNANICETCVTVTWEQMNLQLLRLTGDPRYANELEKTIYNHLLGAQKPTGDDWSYYTPLEGHKPYDRATTCCHSSGPRGVALIPGIAYMTSADGGVVVNLYNESKAKVHVKAGSVTVTQSTGYPLTGSVSITVSPEKQGQRFPLRLRIPPCTSGYTVHLNGKPVSLEISESKADYIVLDRDWNADDTVTLDLKLLDRVVLGDHENSGKAALMHGPLVLALDSHENPGVGSLNRVGLGLDSAEISPRFALESDSRFDRIPFSVEGEVAGKGKTSLTLLPYAQAGSDGISRFQVWIPLSAPPLEAQSLLSGCPWTASRRGNVEGAITDDDLSTFAVTFTNDKADEDWFAVTAKSPTTVDRVVFAHGQYFHDGGWFDSEGGRNKPRIQVQTEVGGPWKTVATLDGYPNTTSSNAAGLTNGQKFEARFTPVAVVAIRVIGAPASGDNPAQNFASCAELQAFFEPR